MNSFSYENPQISASVSGGYRYAFNGMEKTDEITGNPGDSYDFGARMYDARLGRWLSIDPAFFSYPENTAYCFTLNNPINFIDPDGEDVIVSEALRNDADKRRAVKLMLGVVLSDKGLAIRITTNGEVQFKNEKYAERFVRRTERKIKNHRKIGDARVKSYKLAKMILDPATESHHEIVEGDNLNGDLVVITNDQIIVDDVISKEIEETKYDEKDDPTKRKMKKMKWAAYKKLLAGSFSVAVAGTFTSDEITSSHLPNEYDPKEGEVEEVKKEDPRKPESKKDEKRRSKQDSHPSKKPQHKWIQKR